MLLGDSIDYNPAGSPYPNLFDIKFADPMHHFVRFLALNFLTEVNLGVSGRRLTATANVVEFLLQLGYQTDFVTESLESLAEFQCIEGEIPEEPWKSGVPHVRITEKGDYLVKTLCASFVYYDLVVCDTPIIDEECRKLIGDTDNLRNRIQRCGTFLQYLDTCSEHVSDGKSKSWWKECLGAVRKDIGIVKRNAARRGML
jgi:hypothetical protein